MAAPERFAEMSDSSCTAGAVHTWHFSDLTGADRMSVLEGRADFPIARQTSEFDPSRTWAWPDIGPQFCYIDHSISRASGCHLEQRARRAATGGYSGGGCRGLLPLDRDRRRRHAGATEGCLERRFLIPKSLSIADASSRIPGTALSSSSPAWSMPCDVPSKFSAAWPNKISTCRRTSGSNFASAFTSVILSSKTMISLVMGSILQCVSKGSQSRVGFAFPTTLIGRFGARLRSPSRIWVRKL